MSQQPKSQLYQKALSFAEAGQYEDALGLIREHLRSQPNDGEALNDAGTILFCMGRGAEAIEYLEKARCHVQGALSGQVLWNLGEAYIQEGRTAEAYRLFDAMAEAGVLNVDVLNRTANAFLSRDALGGAVECLLRSLKEAPEQEILRPMVELIRHRRPTAIAAGDEETETLQQVCAYLEPRFRSQRIVGDCRALSSAQAGIVVTIGTGPALRNIAVNKGTKKLIAVLQSQDVYTQDLESIFWAGVDSVLLCGTSAQMEILSERTPAICRQTSVCITTEPFAVEEFTFTQRRRGKRLAAIGPFDAFNNPAFLLQGMQKLHYLDADYRLYLAGEFRDKALEQYCRWMTARLNLEGVVFFDGPVQNIENWLRDKQYVVSSAINPAHIRGLWTAMACGLRPVVHSFAGAQECVPESCLFDIAEDFCRQVQNSDPALENYRGWLEQKIGNDGFYSQLTAELLKLERQIHLACAVQRSAAPAIPTKPAGPAADAGVAQPQSVRTIPAVPLHSAPTAPVIPTPRPAHPVQNKSVNEVAAEALRASQRLKEILQESDSQRQTVSSRESLSAPFVP